MACPTLDTKLARACTSGLAKVRDPIMLRQLIAQNLCGASLNPTTPSIAYNNLALLADPVAKTSFSTAAYQPTSNSLILAMVCSNETNGNNTVVSVTGNGLTFSLVNTITSGFKNANRVSVYRALSAAPTNVAMTVNFGAFSQNSCAIKIFEFTNVDTSGVNGSGAIVQSGSASANTANPTVTLAALNSSGRNAVFASSINAVNPYAASPKAGWTEDDDGGVGGTGVMGYYSTHQLASVDNAAGLVRVINIWGMVAAEVKAI